MDGSLLALALTMDASRSNPVAVTVTAIAWALSLRSWELVTGIEVRCGRLNEISAHTHIDTCTDTFLKCVRVQA